MSESTRRLRTALPELTVQAVMVVFAVVVALAVEEWRDEREMQDFADRARAAVLAEISANLEELRSTGPALDSVATMLTGVIQSGDPSPLGTNLSLTVPEFSSAAWRAAQSSQAAQRLDYDWVIQVSRAHESYEYYSSIADRLIDAMSEMIGRELTMESVDGVYGYVLILAGLHGQVEERLEALVESSDSR